jgi:hypothetical protein
MFEGQRDTRRIDDDIQRHNTIAERVVALLPQLRLRGEGPAFGGLTFTGKLAFLGIHRRRRRRT